ncbi:hypothetical protein DBR43_07620 [Pedobacter sp. KBW06]|uniref:DUF1801 domain-containing protein n=1 Tax=Pedobacter sp. KBW06 TaxID=2153359 RepID=UPI000F59866E|nr:DUF1801 domain-containing protein [Pedobacter sp. KBW06]RQO75220.1 hypothetical protein DBR43_07620 [Pedobacter sp. KBW06]
MAKNKTTETAENIDDFLGKVTDPVKRKDSYTLIEMMEKASGFPAKMWGPSIIGFGSYHYKYKSGHEGDAPLLAFSPRNSAFSLYLSCDSKMKEELIQQLGKYKMAKSCIYIKKLEDIDLSVLAKMIDYSLKFQEETK